MTLMIEIISPHKIKNFYIYLSLCVFRQTWIGKFLSAELLEEIRYFRWQEFQREELLLLDYVDRIVRSQKKNKEYSGIYEHRTNFFLIKKNIKYCLGISNNSCLYLQEQIWGSKIA